MSEVLHVGTAIIGWMRSQATVPDPDLHCASGTIGSLFGVPVIEEPTWNGGRWEMHNGVEVVASGQVGPADKIVAYISGIGFVAIDPDLPGGLPPLRPERLPTRYVWPERAIGSISPWGRSLRP